MVRTFLLSAFFVAPAGFADLEHHHLYGRSMVVPGAEVAREPALTSEAVVETDQLDEQVVVEEEEPFRTDADSEVDQIDNDTPVNQVDDDAPVEQIDNDREVGQIGEEDEIFTVPEHSDQFTVIGEDEEIDVIGDDTMYEADSIYDDAPDVVVTDDDIVRTTPEGDTMVWDDVTGQYVIERDP